LLYELLPLLRGWMYQYVEKTSTLTLGREATIDTVEAKGWLLTAAAFLSGSRDAKYVRIHVEIDGPDRAYPIDFSLQGLKEFGVNQPINYGAFLLRYSDEEKKYAGAITPSKPMPIAKKLEVKLIPPQAPIEETTALPISYHCAYALAKVIDEEEFKRSLRELLKGEDK